LFQSIYGKGETAETRHARARGTRIDEEAQKNISGKIVRLGAGGAARAVFILKLEPHLRRMKSCPAASAGATLMSHRKKYRCTIFDSDQRS
jgi:hypothetical protein